MKGKTSGEPHAKRPRRSATDQAATLIDVLVATMILGIALISVTESTSRTVELKATLEQDPTTAYVLAKEIFELAQTLPKQPSGVTAATSPTQVEALDSLAGAEFSPPLLANGSVDSAHTGWTQVVDLALYDLDDLGTPTGEDATAKVGAHQARLYQLRVAVLQGTEEVGVYRWWLTP